jgi:putative addiction module component (TIGR02574 family)
MNDQLRASISKLTAREKMELALELLDEIGDSGEAYSLTEAQMRELDRRIAHFRANPDDWSPWAEVVDRIRARARSRGFHQARDPEP